MDWPRVYHTKQRKSEIEKYRITYMWNLKYDTKELINETETPCYITFMWNLWLQGGGGGKDWEFVISIYKLLFIGWINNRVLCVTQGTVDQEQCGSKGQDLFLLCLPTERINACLFSTYCCLSRQAQPCITRVLRLWTPITVCRVFPSSKPFLGTSWVSYLSTCMILCA